MWSLRSRSNRALPHPAILLILITAVQDSYRTTTPTPTPTTSDAPNDLPFQFAVEREKLHDVDTEPSVLSVAQRARPEQPPPSDPVAGLTNAGATYLDADSTLAAIRVLPPFAETLSTYARKPINNLTPDACAALPCESLVPDISNEFIDLVIPRAGRCICYSPTKWAEPADSQRTLDVLNDEVGSAGLPDSPVAGSYSSSSENNDIPLSLRMCAQPIASVEFVVDAQSTFEPADGEELEVEAFAAAVPTPVNLHDVSAFRL